MRQLFRVFIPTSVIALAFSEFSFIFLCYVAGSWLVSRFINPNLVVGAFLVDEGGLIQITVVTVCLVLGLYFQSLYTNVRVKSLTLLVQQVCLVIGLAFLIQALFAYIRRPEWSLPRWAMIFGSVLALVVIPGWRVFFSRVVLKFIGFQRVLFLGTSAVSKEIAAHLVARPETGMSVLGYIDDGEDSGSLPGGKILGQIKDLTTLAQALKPDIVVVGMAERRKRTAYVGDALSAFFGSTLRGSRRYLRSDVRACVHPRNASVASCFFF